MRTPAGKECRYYYEDFHRGRSLQECRLLKDPPPRKPWKPSDCSKCPVPSILWANASEDLVLEANIDPGVFGLGRKVEIISSCKKHGTAIPDPYVGCELCSEEKPGLALFDIGDDTR